jgi:phosphatidylserine synthase 2
MPTDPVEHRTILQANTWRAIYGMIIFMLAFAYLKPYREYRVGDSMQRVHRIIVMIMLLYMCFLIFMLMMRPDYGRQFLGFLDDSLNKPVTKEMHTYDDNCELEWENIWDNFDHYYLIHWVDWILASLVIRDPYILHFWQVFDEVIELSLQHILPHFRECWWDHLLVDITLSNIPAIMLGMWILRKFGIREMDWLGRKGK